MRFLRFLPIPLLLVVVVLAAGCGSGGGPKSVPADGVAVVGNDTVTKAQFNELLSGAKRNYVARKTPFPKPGTAQYKSLQDQLVQYLVQLEELKQKAADLGITISQADVQKKLVALRKQYSLTSDKKYQAALKAQGVTEAQLKQQLYSTILSDRIFKKVTANVKVSDADVTKYYDQHKQSYTQAASRDVRHIIQALSAVKPAKQTPLKDVKQSIRQQLLQTKKTSTMTTWFDTVKTAFAKKIAYQTGYAPPATTTSTTQTTTTG